MNSVGIDVSKGRSMVAALRPMGELVLRPTEYLHTEIGLERLAYDIPLSEKIPAWLWKPQVAITNP